MARFARGHLCVQNQNAVADDTHAGRGRRRDGQIQRYRSDSRLRRRRSIIFDGRLSGHRSLKNRRLLLRAACVALPSVAPGGRKAGQNREQSKNGGDRNPAGGRWNALLKLSGSTTVRNIAARGVVVGQKGFFIKPKVT